MWVDVDFTELFALRAAAKAAGKPVPGLLAYLARFTVAALRAHPELNGEVDAVNDELIQYAGINLGLAVQTDRGLLAPAVLDAHLLTTAELDAEIRRVTEAAREGRATQAELTAGTFTLNNYGRSTSTAVRRSSTTRRSRSSASAGSSTVPGSSTASWRSARSPRCRSCSITGCATAALPLPSCGSSPTRSSHPHRRSPTSELPFGPLASEKSAPARGTRA